jgi:hypothetical protein
MLILCIERGRSVQRVFKAATERLVQAILRADNLGKIIHKLKWVVKMSAFIKELCFS